MNALYNRYYIKYLYFGSVTLASPNEKKVKAEILKVGQISRTPDSSLFDKHLYIYININK